MRLCGNTILITGASGVGRALAAAFHRLGNQVVITDRRQQLLDEITAACSGMYGARLDVGDPDAVSAFAAFAREQLPDLNVLVDTVGIIEDLAAADLFTAESAFQADVTGFCQLTAALLPTLVRQPSATIVTTTSDLLSSMPICCASKALLHFWLQALRYALENTPVEVIELPSPPYARADLGGPGRVLDPDAAPWADYVDDVLESLWNGDPSRGEVERGEALRRAERTGRYGDMVATAHAVAETS